MPKSARPPARSAGHTATPPLAEPKVAYSTGKQRLNLLVRTDLLMQARELELNLSQVMEESLAATLHQVQRERWLAENAEAIAAYNRRVERDGPLCADLVTL